MSVSFEQRIKKSNNKYSYELVSKYKTIDELFDMYCYVKDRIPLFKFKHIINKFAIGGDFSNWKYRLDYIINDKNVLARTKEKTIILYGEKVGTERWDSYCKKQALTNTFEYKHKKYGMTEDEFNDYNKSRAVTLENMIQRYGTEDGTKRYNEYCVRQSYAGCSKEYFIEKYGEEVGLLEWERVCSRKSHSLKSFIDRYGENEGIIKYKSFWDNRELTSSTYSKQSQELFNRIYDILPVELKNSTYYGTHNKEFGKYDDVNKLYYFYDFVINDIKFCVEYNGDYWHGNPKKYSGDDVLAIRNKKYDEIWKFDKEKVSFLQNLGYDVIVIWESDYVENPERIIGEIYEKIIEKHKLGSC